MTSFESFPAELVIKTLAFTSGKDLVNLSQINHRWYELGRKRREQHRDYRSTFGTLRKFVWLDALGVALRNPWIIPYITDVTVDYSETERRTLSGMGDVSALYLDDDDLQTLWQGFEDFPSLRAMSWLDGSNRLEGDAPWFRPYQPFNGSAILLLLTLLTHLRSLKIIALSARNPAQWQIVDLIGRMAGQVSMDPKGHFGALAMSNLRYVEYEGEIFIHYEDIAGSNFLVPFLTLPRLKALQLLRIYGRSIIWFPNLPVTNLTSLVLLHSPFTPEAISWMLAATPYLQRFVCLNHLNDRLLAYDVAGYLRALADNPDVRHSLKLLALDSSLNEGGIAIVPSEYDFCIMRNLSSLSLLYLHVDLVPTLCNAMIATGDSSNVRTLAVPNMLDFYSTTSFWTGLIKVVSSTFDRLFLHPREGKGSDTIAGNELLLAACKENGIFPTILGADFRMDVVAGMNEKWRQYV